MKGNIQIDTREWLQLKDNLLEVRQISGRLTPTGITRATFVGNGISDIKKDDAILLSKVACDVATTPFAQYDVEGKKYFNLPEEQIIGVFQNEISIEALSLRNNNILFKKIDKKKDSILMIEEKDTMLGKVVKTGPQSSLNNGDVIAVRDNVSTHVADDYYIVEEKFVVGVCRNDFSIENMEIKNEYVLMKPYISRGVLNSTLLETADINYNELDYTDINNRNLFKVVYADSHLKGIKPEDIILVDRNYTNYMYYNNEKYFVINERRWISGKIIEREEQCN